MGRRSITFTPKNFYHIYNRGNSKQKIFLDETDYDRFKKLLFVCNSLRSFNFRDDIQYHEIDAYNFDRGESLIEICAWVLMPNHFHLLIYLPETGPREDVLSLFLRKLLTAYAGYFNKKYERTGALFEGRYKATHANSDPYLRYLFSYIHLNPVKLIQSDWKENGIKDIQKTLAYAKDFPHSSFQDYLQLFPRTGLGKDDTRRELGIINSGSFKKVLPENWKPEKDLLEWLSYGTGLGR